MLPAPAREAVWVVAADGSDGGYVDRSHRRNAG